MHGRLSGAKASAVSVIQPWRSGRDGKACILGERGCPSENDDEWEDFQSVIWSDPEGEESTSFDEASKIAERAFYGEGYPASGYIHLHVLIGGYLRRNLKAMLHPEDLKK